MQYLSDGEGPWTKQQTEQLTDSYNDVKRSLTAYRLSGRLLTAGVPMTCPLTVGLGAGRLRGGARSARPAGVPELAARGVRAGQVGRPVRRGRGVGAVDLGRHGPLVGARSGTRGGAAHEIADAGLGVDSSRSLALRHALLGIAAGAAALETAIARASEDGWGLAVVADPGADPWTSSVRTPASNSRN